MTKYVITALSTMLILALIVVAVGSIFLCFANEPNSSNIIITSVSELKPEVTCPPLEPLAPITEPVTELVTEPITEPVTEAIVSSPIIPYKVITEEEREMLARLTWLESGICSFDCQVAVVSVVFNRLDSEKWKTDMNGDGVITLYDIIYYPHAFTPAYKIPYVEASQSCYDAVDYVLLNGPVFHNGVRYFRIDHDFNWSEYNNYCVIDNVYFGYFDGWENGGW